MGPGDRVIYIPGHAHGDRNHADIERGTISSVKGDNAFVKFDQYVAQLGWDNTVSQSCYLCDLVLERQ